MKYSDQVADWLVKLGYSHCFYVAGGNTMHLLESLSQRLDCRPVVHEVAAGIAAEYFNEISDGGKALVLVTAGPGMTNLITALAGAYLESRELLVIGGQVKTADLARGKLRQRGIQEIDGVALARPVTVRSELVDAPLPFADFAALVRATSRPRKGPVFIEMPLDVQARDVTFSPVRDEAAADSYSLPCISDADFRRLVERICTAKRPLLLLGGGVSRETVAGVSERLIASGLPIATTWNAADRIDSAAKCYVGRPNTWGQRSANLVLQQCDLLVALGTRLGMQQTGFNWQSFVPGGQIVQVDLDASELGKGHPKVDMPLQADANDVLVRLVNADLGDHGEWLGYAQGVRAAIPLVEAVNKTGEQYISPFTFADTLSTLCNNEDIVIPCSSGSAFTVMMQTFRQKSGQLIVTNKGLASMGYGLSGAIGAAFAYPARRVILVEGDGGFAQNLQEIGTAAINQLNLKMFVFDDAGYASIRMTQRSYFGGRYVGCDRKTGLGLPDWEKLFAAWDVPAIRIGKNYASSEDFKRLFDSAGPAAFIVSVDPEQTYFPKITSRINETGAMESNPLHLMTPDLEPELFGRVTQFLNI
ncbi:acetolactate synthase isozyme 1 large subunit [mine drainage metagenome]|uniref:Acetolactate synthase isozyme 1 large subunit n=1 Tax=mine drainage metagenome TaxID=410659 RepID=A0A1J5QQJ3_9ZZZZ